MRWIQKLSGTDYGEQFYQACFSNFRSALKAYVSGDYAEAANISSNFLTRFPDSDVSDIFKGNFSEKASFLGMQKKLWIPFSADFILMTSIGSYIRGDFNTSVMERCLLSESCGEFSWYPGQPRPDDLPESGRYFIRMPSASRVYKSSLWSSTLLTLNTIHDAKTHEVDIASFNIGIPHQYEITRAYNRGVLLPQKERLPFKINMDGAVLELNLDSKRDDCSFKTDVIIEEYAYIARSIVDRSNANVLKPVSDKVLNDVARILKQNGYLWERI